MSIRHPQHLHTPTGTTPRQKHLQARLAQPPPATSKPTTLPSSSACTDPEESATVTKNSSRRGYRRKTMQRHTARLHHRHRVALTDAVSTSPTPLVVDAYNSAAVKARLGAQGSPSHIASSVPIIRSHSRPLALVSSRSRALDRLRSRPPAPRSY